MTRPVLFTETGTRRGVVTSFPRASFVRERFNYKPGEHVVFAGPTGNGKTTLAFALLEQVASPECPAYVAVTKPRDPVTEREGERLGFRRVDSWPPKKTVKELVSRDKPPGYLVWSRFGDIDSDEYRASVLTRQLIRDRYTAGMKHEDSILVMDDTVIKSKTLGLDTEMVRVLTMGGAMRVGIWTFVQKPTDAGKAALWSYSQSEHLFLTQDPDENNQRRYGEIGGVDPKQVRRALAALDEYEYLYLKRSGRYMAIVEAN